MSLFHTPFNACLITFHVIVSAFLIGHCMLLTELLSHWYSYVTTLPITSVHPHMWFIVLSYGKQKHPSYLTGVIVCGYLLVLLILWSCSSVSPIGCCLSDFQFGWLDDPLVFTLTIIVSPRAYPIIVICSEYQQTQLQVLCDCLNLFSGVLNVQS